MRNIKIFDTTLRDGEQAPGCTMDLQEKLEVARQLEALGVDIIEAGFAISSKGDFESVSSIAGVLKRCTVASLARSTKGDIDAAYNAVKHAVSPRIHLFLATSPIHMQYKLKMSPEKVLQTAIDSVRYAKSLCSDVEFSAEDATRTDKDFLAEVMYEVIKAGATTINIPDTVGYTAPDEFMELIKYLKYNVENIDDAVISVHCHDDLGMAVANSLAGVLAGAGQLECTINGIGERAGNAALEELVMAIKTRGELYNCQTAIDTTQIYRTSKMIYSIIGQPAPLNKSIVGANAFLHESGIHQHGVLSEKSTYEIMTPESVGIHKTNMVLGKHSGRHAFEERVKELGFNLDSEDLNRYFAKFKEICDKKKQVTDSDIEAIVSHKIRIGAIYELDSFDVHTGRSTSATSVVRLIKEGRMLEEVALGDGPIDAAYNAIDRITGIACTLEFYSINSTSGGKDALGEVVVKINTGEELLTGRGLSTDIIESSILAYLNAVNKKVEKI